MSRQNPYPENRYTVSLSLGVAWTSRGTWEATATRADGATFCGVSKASPAAAAAEAVRDMMTSTTAVAL